MGDSELHGCRVNRGSSEVLGWLWSLCAHHLGEQHQQHI